MDVIFPGKDFPEATRVLHKFYKENKTYAAIFTEYIWSYDSEQLTTPRCDLSTGSTLKRVNRRKVKLGVSRASENVYILHNSNFTGSGIMIASKV